jgi:hypothetical protein
VPHFDTDGIRTKATLPERKIGKGEGQAPAFITAL